MQDTVDVFWKGNQLILNLLINYILLYKIYGANKSYKLKYEDLFLFSTMIPENWLEGNLKVLLFIHELSQSDKHEPRPTK